MPTDTEKAKLQVLGGLQQNIATRDLALAEVQRMRRRTVTIYVQDAATAGTAVTETVMLCCPAGGTIRVVSAKVAAPVAIAADNTDYCTFTVSKRTGAGSATSVSSADTRAASLNALAAFVPEALTNSTTAADLDLAASDVLTFKVVKSGSGKAICAATSYFACTVEYEET